MIDQIAINPILPTDYYIRTYFNEPMIGALSDTTVELTGATTGSNDTAKRLPYVAPIHLGEAIVLAQLSKDAGYTIPATYFDPPELRRDINELRREFPKSLFTGADSPPGGTKVYASIDLNGPDDLILSQVHNFIRLQRRKFGIDPPSKPQHTSINKLVDYKTLEILDLENWSRLHDTNMSSSVYRSLFDDPNLTASKYRRTQQAFAHQSLLSKFLKHLEAI